MASQRALGCILGHGVLKSPFSSLKTVFFSSIAASSALEKEQQNFGKLALNVDINYGLLSISGGPKGGADLYTRRRPQLRLEPSFNGSGQSLAAAAYGVVESEIIAFNQRRLDVMKKVGVPGILDPLHRHSVTVPSGSPSQGQEYIIPGANNNNNANILEDPVPSLYIPNAPIQDAPNNPNATEKQAARLIVIRRTKMNKHKLRKLRKKMHFKWLKVKERRYVRKEKAYLDEKMALIQAAVKFDAKEYVAGVIKKAKEEPIPRKWTDPLMPEWFKEQEMAKEARLKRYQKVVNMYLNRSIKIKTE